MYFLFTRNIKVLSAGLQLTRDKVKSILNQYTWASECEIVIRKNVNCGVKNARQSKKLTRGHLESGLGLD